MRRANEEPTTGAQSWVKVTHYMLVVEQKRASLITLPMEIIMFLQLERILSPLLEGYRSLVGSVERKKQGNNRRKNTQKYK
jgi:hypothetical protein